MEENDLVVHEFKAVDLRGATIIDGFPSVGLVSTITANYLIDILELEQVGTMDSKYFPTVSIVRNAVPMYPVRIYAGKGVCIFISEFQPAPKLIRPIAEAIVEFAKKKGCKTIISPEGLVIEAAEAPAEVAVYAIGATEEARALLDRHKLTPFGNGIITGVSGVLLNLGKAHGLDTISILAEANPNYPDARAAAKVIEVIDELLENVEIDVKPLYSEAENIEKTLRMMQRQVEPKTSGKDSSPAMYG
ncbi:MAG: proteasome assembly chaperone family protein [Euryarchaeota archaeon]|nr:proteasome assembly chaperone family protein [Euryarchaeota archaeon]